MPHSRKRHITRLIEKKLKFSPIVAIQGARQTGKSFIGREILPHSLPDAQYLSLDEKELRLSAQNSPDDFLKRYPTALPLIIDEAQKSPDLFDALKLNVDQNRTPGKFVLLGSTEFSTLSQIRESLTGRMSRVRVFPFTVAESLSLPLNPSKDSHQFNKTPRIKREDLHLYLERGGLPGLFAVRSLLERESAITDLLDLILFRDARFVRWFDPELGREILEQVARLSTPSLAEISTATQTDSRRVKRHLEVLQELFVLGSISPHPLGYGKNLYFLYDCALARFLGAGQLRILQTWFLNEQLSQRTCSGELKWKLTHYSTQKGSRVDFMIESSGQLCAVKIFDEPRIRKTDLLILTALKKKAGKSIPVRLVALGPYSKSFQEGEVEFYPFESVV